MASIPGPVTFIVGLVVSGISFFLNKKSFAFNGAYSLFLYFGLILVFYGFVKILIWYITRKSNEEKKEDIKKDIKPGGVNAPSQGFNSQSQIPQSQMVENNITNGKGYDSERYNYVLKCRNCGLTHYAAYANFCQNCGSRLR